MAADIGLFGVWDYVVFVLSLALSASIGIYYAIVGQKTARDFLMASQSMGILPISLSLLASFISGISLIGIPAEVYSFGVNTFLSMIGLVGAVLMASLFYLPTFYNLEFISAYEVSTTLFLTMVVDF